MDCSFLGSFFQACTGQENEGAPVERSAQERRSSILLKKVQAAQAERISGV